MEILSLEEFEKGIEYYAKRAIEVGAFYSVKTPSGSIVVINKDDFDFLDKALQKCKEHNILVDEN